MFCFFSILLRYFNYNLEGPCEEEKNLISSTDSVLTNFAEFQENNENSKSENNNLMEKKKREIIFIKKISFY